MSSFGQSLAQALQAQRTHLPVDGELDLSGSIRFDRHDLLAQIGSQKALRKLTLRNSPLTSLQTLLPQPNLKILIADDSRIENLAGLDTQPRLSSVSLIGTPVSETPNFRLSVLLCVGPRVSSINGILVTENERKLAQCYPPIAKHLVARGWIVEFPPPSKLDFKYLARQFRFESRDEDFTPAIPAVDARPPEDESALEPATLADKLTDGLRPMGFPVRIGREQNRDILEAIAQMCDILAKVESVANPGSIQLT